MQFTQNPRFGDKHLSIKAWKFILNLIGFIYKVSFHTFLDLIPPFSSPLLLPLPLLLFFALPSLSLRFLFSHKMRPIWSLKHGFNKAMFGQDKNPFLAFSFSFLHSSLITPLIYEYIFHYFFFGPKSFHIRTFKPLFGPITILFLCFITFRVSRFPVLHLTHETVKLGLKNTLNMSKTTRVYFGVLHA